VETRFQIWNANNIICNRPLVSVASARARWFAIHFLCFPRNVRESPHILWLDNFTRFLPRRVFTLSSDSYTACAWTVGMVREPPSALQATLAAPPVGVDLFLPPDLYIYKDELCRLISDQCRAASLYETSYATLFDLHAVPPGFPKSADASEKMKLFFPAVEHRVASLDAWSPLGMEGSNIGSNTGLLSVLLRWTPELFDDAHAKPTWLLSDINIFNRLCKVALCTSFGVPVLSSLLHPKHCHC
jgi:hypothetical protein